MKLKRNKRTKKLVQHYKFNFGHRPPYKVLLDGCFLAACAALKQGEVEQMLTKLLGAPVKLFVTRCITRELQGMGSEHSAVAKAARSLRVLAGDLDPPASAADSIRAAVGDSNKEHLWVATQDDSLKRSLREVPGVPVVFLSASGPGVEPPGAAGGREKPGKRKRAAERGAEDGETSDSDAEAAGKAPEEEAPPKRKRRRPMAPNPLSMKKKKAKPAPAPTPSNPDKQPRKRIRKR
mmetsp:Transcript_25974/g.85425  ORF Transcript_25974/g.85425 Transcript_25974/m.85425 type:complete len:236 (-) Transcript_25974:77-784(-)